MNLCSPENEGDREQEDLHNKDTEGFDGST